MEEQEAQLLTIISQEIDDLRNLITINPKYPKVSANDLLDNLKHKLKVLDTIRDHSAQIGPGDWVQVFVESANPFYAKIALLVEHDEYATMEGVYKTENDEVIQQIFPLKSCVKLPRETARALEFANGLNSMKFEEHTHVRSEK